MAGKLKGLIAVVSVGMFIYLVSSGNTSVAEDGEIDIQGQFAGATISVEASLVAVEQDVLEEIVGGSGMPALTSIPPEKIMRCVREDEGGQVISIVKLAAGNGSAAEMNTEKNEQSRRKDSGEENNENEGRETHVSFQVIPKIIGMNRIAVSFDFKQIVSESAFVSEGQAEEQNEIVTEFEVSSKLVLRPGQPRIVAATRKDNAVFLIMDVDI